MRRDEAMETLKQRAVRLEQDIQGATLDKAKAEADVVIALQCIERFSFGLADVHRAIAILEKG